MRKLVTLAAAAIAALAIAAPAAVAQDVVVSGGEDITLSSGYDELNSVLHYSSSNEYRSWGCSTEWTAGIGETGQGAVATFEELQDPTNQICGRWGTCGSGTTADWDITIYATGLSSPEFRAQIDMCTTYNAWQFTGSVTADVEMSGSTATALQFDDAQMANQSPAPVTGMIPAYAVDGTLTFNDPVEIEEAP